MNLSQEQNDKLLELIKQDAPNYKIGEYLMSCGLSLRETVDVRRRAEVELKSYSEELSFAKILESPPEQIVSAPEENPKCVSCGKETDDCFCPIKTVDQIPF